MLVSAQPSVELPRFTSVGEEAVAERAQGLRQCRLMKLVVVFRVFDVVVMDEVATVEFHLLV